MTTAHHLKQALCAENVSVWKYILEWAPGFSLTKGWQTEASLLDAVISTLNKEASRSLKSGDTSRSRNTNISDGLSAVLYVLFNQLKSGSSEINGLIWSKLYRVASQNLQPRGTPQKESFDALMNIFLLILPEGNERKIAFQMAAVDWSKQPNREKKDEFLKLLIQYGLDKDFLIGCRWSSNDSLYTYQRATSSIWPSTAFEINSLSGWTDAEIQHGAMKIMWTRMDAENFSDPKKSGNRTHGNEFYGFFDEAEITNNQYLSREFVILEHEMSRRHFTKQEKTWIAAKTAWSSQELLNRMQLINGTRTIPWDMKSSNGENLFQYMALWSVDRILEISMGSESQRPGPEAIKNKDNKGIGIAGYMVAGASVYKKEDVLGGRAWQSLVKLCIGNTTTITEGDALQFFIDGRSDAIECLKPGLPEKDQHGRSTRFFTFDIWNKIFKGNDDFKKLCENNEPFGEEVALAALSTQRFEWLMSGVFNNFNTGKEIIPTKNDANYSMARTLFTLLRLSSYDAKKIDFNKVHDTVIQTIKFGADWESWNSLIAKGKDTISGTPYGNGTDGSSGFTLIEDFWNDTAKKEHEKRKLMTAAALQSHQSKKTFHVL